MSSRYQAPGRSFRPTAVLAIAGIATALYLSDAVAQRELPILLDGEVTSDGLYPLDPSVMGAAWIRPDIDLSNYTGLLAGGTAIQFRDVRDRWHNSRSIETAEAFYIDERRKASLRELFDASFDHALDAVRSFDRATEAGPNVIAVQGFLTDVISGVPPYIPGSAVTNIRWPWEANIVLEVRDSVSLTVLARTVVRERVNGPIDASMVGQLTPRVVDAWTKLLVTRLEQLRDFYPSRLSRLGERDRD